MVNTYNNIEEYIKGLLHHIDIYHPHQLNIENVHARLGMEVHYIEQDAMFVFGRIFLDSRKSAYHQWQEFGHELCHALWHAGNQALIPISMREYQEWKAENFSQQLCCNRQYQLNIFCSFTLDTFLLFKNFLLMFQSMAFIVHMDDLYSV